MLPDVRTWIYGNSDETTTSLFTGDERISDVLTDFLTPSAWTQNLTSTHDASCEWTNVYHGHIPGLSHAWYDLSLVAQTPEKNIE